MISRFAILWENLCECCDWRQGLGFGSLAAYLLILSISPVFTTASTLLFSSWRALLLFSAVLFLGFFFLILNRFPLLLEGKNLLYFAFLGELLTLAGLGYSLFPVHSLGGDIASAASVSFGMVLLVLVWAKPFTETKLRGRVVVTAMSALIACLLYFLVVFLPAPLNTIAGLLLTLISVFLFFLTRTKSAEKPFLSTGASLQNILSHSRRKGFPYERGIVTAALAYGSLFVLAGHALPFHENEWLFSPLPGAFNVLVFFVAQITLALYMTKVVQKESPDAAYRPVNLILAGALALLPFTSGLATFLCMALVLAGFGCALVFLWISLGNTCQRYSVYPGQAYTLGILYILAGMLLGEGFVSFVLFLDIPMYIYTSALTSAGLFLIVLVLWQQSSGAAHANETKEMGGTSFEGEPSSSYQDLRAFITRYHLSEREGQVLSLWISGRDVPYICDELFIAKNTVKTHLKHIYEKTGVTGKQELINLALS